MSTIIRLLTSTMLIERLTGVVVYAAALGYFYNKIRHAGSAQAISKYLNQFLVLLCIMAFFYIPGRNADLYRWRLLAAPWKGRSFAWFWKNRVLPSNTPLGYLLIYACQMTGIDGLLPMVCALGFYGSVFHILKREAAREDRSPDTIAVVLLFVMCSGVFLEVISSIRCMLAFAIVLRCVYDEFHEKKGFIKHIPFYVIASLLHNSALPLVGFRLVCLLFEKKRSAILTIINMFTVVIVFAAAIRFGTDYIDAAFAKAQSYTTNDKYSYSWEYIIGGLRMIVLISILWKYKKRYPERWRSELIELRYLLFLTAGDILFLGSYSIFHRFQTAAVVAAIPALASFLNEEEKNDRRVSRNNLVQASLIILLLACVRGNLCGYKFFLLS